MPLPDPIIEVLTAFRPLVTAPTWRKLMTLLTGTLLAQGRRTVAAALRASGNDMAANWSLFYHVLNRARWSPLAVSRQLLLLIVETFIPAGASVDLVIDETLERRWGRKISKRGHYRDSALSSRERSVSSPGLRWIVMAVVVTLPWTHGLRNEMKKGKSEQRRERTGITRCDIPTQRPSSDRESRGLRYSSHTLMLTGSSSSLNEREGNSRFSFKS